MKDIDMILSIVENPTRRRILAALAREPHYPLQLSKELGVSQQAIMKNLDILEKSRLVESRRENGNRGPDKIVYRPISEFTITVDMRSGMFRATLLTPDENDTAPESSDTDLEGIRRNLSEIDRQITELEELRSAMIRKRNGMIRSFMESSVAEDLDYLGRSMLYAMLNSPDHDVKYMSRDMDLREDRMNKIVKDIEFKCRNAKERMSNEQ
ncbi:MAG: helix-turn-helix domain-containing protein [Candidatus Methanoplasma sp.]|jgi:predicted transcriptional regulator|nr:helix-turn-helix domain-containing protein [Candidatus Methanoplasma sp.]